MTVYTINTIKPNYDVKKLANFKAISSNPTDNYKVLFDDKIPISWENADVFYFTTGGTGIYLDIEFYEDVKLHRFYSWSNNNNQKLKIFKHDGTGFNIDMSHLHLDISSQASGTWRQFTDVLPMGLYRFSLDFSQTGFNGRIDGEWYVESTVVNKSLVLNNGEYKKWNEGTAKEVGSKINPVMTSNTSNGEAFGSTFYSSTNNYFHAFDGKDSTSWTSDIGFPQYIGYGFIKSTLVTAYSIQSRNFNKNDITIAPKSWTFEGSNDKQNWVILDTQVEQIYTQKSEEKVYITKNVKKFRFYRINVTKNNGYNGDGAVSIGEVKFYKVDLVDADWSTVSPTLPTQQQFLSEGMDSLSPLLDRRVEELEPLPMADKSEILGGEVGKLFVSEKINLRKYIDIRNIKVEVK